MIRCEMRIAFEETKVDLYNLCREVCSEVLFKEDAKVGGPGKIVGINESKFGERKYHKGKKKDRVWVSGGIGTQRIVFWLVLRTEVWPL